MALAAFAFVRLLQVTFNEDSRLDAERQLVRQKVFSEVAKTAKGRIGFNETKQSLSDNEDTGISFLSFSFLSKGVKTTSIISPKTGEIIKIDTDKLIRASELLNQAKVETVVGSQDSGTAPGEQNVEKKLDYKIHVLSQLHSYVNKNKTVLARIFQG